MFRAVKGDRGPSSLGAPASPGGGGEYDVNKLMVVLHVLRTGLVRLKGMSHCTVILPKTKKDKVLVLE